MHQPALAADAAVVTPFQFHTHSVRVVIRDGDPWFVLADVADALGYRDAANAGRCLADHQRGTQIVSTPSGDQSMTVVNESGLYRLVLRSRKPEAVTFSDWVTGEVLPSIRKTGSYGGPDAQQIAAYRTQAAAVGMAAEREMFKALMEGKPHLRIVAWRTQDWKDREVADAKALAPEAVCMRFGEIAEAMERDGLAAGVPTAELLALANACINRVKRLEESRLRIEAKRRAA